MSIARIIKCSILEYVKLLLISCLYCCTFITCLLMQVQESVTSDNVMVQYHALGLLYHIRYYLSLSLANPLSLSFSLFLSLSFSLSLFLSLTLSLSLSLSLKLGVLFIYSCMYVLVCTPRQVRERHCFGLLQITNIRASDHKSW